MGIRAAPVPGSSMRRERAATDRHFQRDQRRRLGILDASDALSRASRWHRSRRTETSDSRRRFDVHLFSKHRISFAARFLRDAAGSRRELRGQSRMIIRPHGYPKPSVWCFIGDGGEEEGHFYEAAMFVEANDLPCTFIIEDNNRSVDTSREHRRGAAKGLEHLFKCVRRYHYTPTYPHAGSGCSFKIEFDKSAIERHRRR